MMRSLLKKQLLLNKQISILGCGWLGLPLALHLIDLGYIIKGTTTSVSKLDLLKSQGITPFHIKLSEEGITGNIKSFLSESQLLIINIPPGLRKNPGKNHVAEIQHLINAIEYAALKHIIFISSTSVYEDNYTFPTIYETDTPNAASNNGQQLIQIENMLREHSGFKTTIIRLSGLFDHQRHPAKILSGRKNLNHGDAPVNLIHKSDAISAIAKVIRSQTWNHTFNLAYPDHPPKKDYYTNYCQKHNIPLPYYDTKEKSKGKIIAMTSMAQLLNFKFQEPL